MNPRFSVNADLLQYRDKTGNCFSIKEEGLICPKGDEISDVPPQAWFDAKSVIYVWIICLDII